MPTQVSSIIRSATRKNGEKLNILCMPTHERYESNLARTGHNFYAWRTLDGSVKDWSTDYAPLPTNYTLLNPYNGSNQIPEWLDIDLVLSQNKFGQFNIAAQVANYLNVPLISLEHTLPVPNWDSSVLKGLKNMAGNMNVFISEFSRKAWGWRDDEADVVHHGIDTDVFCDLGIKSKKQHILSVVNDWKNRQWCCGIEEWQKITAGLPVFPVGNTPGLSKPAKDIAELVKFYNEAQVFINTSLISPVPTALLEAMSCGCAVVSTATCMIPEIIKNGYNGFISNNIDELRNYAILLLKDSSLREKMGQMARKTILENFSLNKFIDNWNNIFNIASNIYVLDGEINK